MNKLGDMKRLEDVQLLACIQEENRLAFREIVSRYTDTLFRFVNRRIDHEEDAQEIVQDIWLSFWNRRMHIQIESSLYPYLFKAAKFEVIDWMIKNNKRMERLAHYHQNPPHNLLSNSTEEVLIAKELEYYIDREVNKMPDTMKTVFKKSRLQAKSIKHIAKEMSISEQTVKNNISLALTKLRLRLKWALDNS